MKQDINDIIKQVAIKEGISEQEVLDEIQKSIDDAYNNPDPEIQAKWADMPFKEKPAPQELIAYLTGQIKKTLR